MKLQSESARKALLQMIDETGMSTDEVANSSGVGVSSLYRILDLENKTTQRATIRKVAAARIRQGKAQSADLRECLVSLAAAHVRGSVPGRSKARRNLPPAADPGAFVNLNN